MPYGDDTHRPLPVLVLGDVRFLQLKTQKKSSSLVKINQLLEISLNSASVIWVLCFVPTLLSREQRWIHMQLKIALYNALQKTTMTTSFTSSVGTNVLVDKSHKSDSIERRTNIWVSVPGIY